MSMTAIRNSCFPCDKWLKNLSRICSFLKAKKKVIRFSDTFFFFFFFFLNRCVRAAFYFYFPVGYILGHLGLLG